MSKQSTRIKKAITEVVRQSGIVPKGSGKVPKPTKSGKVITKWSL